MTATGTSAILFTVLIVFDFIFLLLTLCLHICGIYVLWYRCKLKKNQQLILFHMSVCEISIAVFRLVCVVFFYEYEDEHAVIGYQVFRTITLQGLCFVYILLLYVVTLDPFFVVTLKTRYLTYVNKKSISGMVASCWCAGVISTSLGFSIGYQERERITAKFTFPALSGSFVVFAVIAYALVYYRLRVNCPSITSGSRRKINVRIPSLIVFTFVVFNVFPCFIMFVYKDMMQKFHYALIAILFSLGMTADALVYICLQPKARQFFFVAKTSAVIRPNFLTSQRHTAHATKGTEKM